MCYGSSMNTKIAVSFDSDGVLADFDKLASTIVGNSSRPTTSQEIEAWWKTLATRPSFFAELDHFPDMIAFVHSLKGKVDYIDVITGKPRPSSFPSAEQDKRAWLGQHLGTDVPVIVCYAKDKHLYIRSEYDIHVLIDDRKSNIDRWVKAGGTGIYHTSYEDTRAQLYKLLNIHQS